MSAHALHMQRALELARLQAGRTGQNPSVGCVILDRDGQRVVAFHFKALPLVGMSLFYSTSTGSGRQLDVR